MWRATLQILALLGSGVTAAGQACKPIPLEQIPSWFARLRPLASFDSNVKTAVELDRSAIGLETTLLVGPFLGVVAFTEDGEDKLFAAWRLSAPGDPQTLAVLDTAYYVALLMVWDHKPFDSAKSVENFTHRVLSPWVFSMLDIKVGWDAAESRVYGGGAAANLAQFVPAQVIGKPAQGGSYVYALIAHKRVLALAYHRVPEASKSLFVPERFPPLRERIGAWSKERLISELDDGGNMYAASRDEILLMELFRRGVSPAEFRKLYRAPGPFRAEHVDKAMILSGRAAQYNVDLSALLWDQTPGDHASQERVRVVLRDFQRHMESNLCEVVSRYVAGGVFEPWASNYIQQRSCR